MIHVEVDKWRSGRVVDALERFAEKFADLFIADVVLGQTTEDEVRARTKELLALGAADGGLDMGTFALLALGVMGASNAVADSLSPSGGEGYTVVGDVKNDPAANKFRQVADYVPEGDS